MNKNVLYKIVFTFRFSYCFFLFDLFVKTLHWILVFIDYFRVILHYLNDFLTIMKFFIDFRSYKIIWRKICKIFDFEINEKKKKFDTKFEFLNIEFDNEIMKIRFFSIKLTKAIKVVNAIFIANTFTYRQIDFFANFLLFCAKIVMFKRFFFVFFVRCSKSNSKRQQIMQNYRNNACKFAIVTKISISMKRRQSVAWDFVTIFKLYLNERFK